ncbi:GNAT family N-acetyltransferase [Agrobacterium sp. SHOUNA12C]|uniref:Acetyltransferase, GNAT family n=2 Tax=Rhizobium rhizogenes TaxID=359 RepID=B9JAJ8_RHIR8|nr:MULTISPECIES: GNAT family N-acetyltransferase [Rhizobium]ACM25681.1 acetyltransferase, GNAT family [Rhizobium rhizogenes K84]KAA6483861.1 GNAT family N-acetyltransferase [Agrobacterium sp. ICMP 7243]MCJ9720954.1 GNAT family N-acetyltransferase [Agrobacterium sp. BETTINA12B]MCJ9757651.1 GNAT family N-acetyltransferase [Agrobacterium sp. SHOUNA12C]OCJ03324.1 acetyltransferase [Agrobacterium sp. 13-626]OCJ19998.1 acetyltransferase [Agrobacterium sp. B131/95]OCJ27112.1 acetyltransferase [Agro
MACDVRPARESDANAISAVILSALRETNAKDYSQDIIARVTQSFSPAAVRKLMVSRTVLVAMKGGDVVGTASLDGAVVRTVFVSPSVQGQGTGTRLMAEIERIAYIKGVTLLTVPSSVTAEAFYARLGFKAVEDSYHGDERTIIMERSLP